tara:strand:+ start:117 stop:506 length:390 start_codon:yes stop_codon:yes gene_type:complete
MTEKLVLNFDEWNINLIDRTKNRMKLQIKLSKDEAQAFKNFMGMVKPPEIDELDFVKGIFKIGVETMEMKLMEAVQQHAEEEGIDLDNLHEDAAELEADQEEIVATVMGDMSDLSDKPSDEDNDELQAD